MSSIQQFTGFVLWFSTSLNYGFISRDGENDLFIHWSDICSPGFKTLKKGQEVAFSVGVNKNGRPKAIQVTVIPERH